MPACLQVMTVSGWRIQHKGSNSLFNELENATCAVCYKGENCFRRPSVQLLIHRLRAHWG